MLMSKSVALLVGGVLCAAEISAVEGQQPITDRVFAMHRATSIPGEDPAVRWPLAPRRRRLGAWAENQHGEHYLFGPSAIPLEGGEGYYHTAYMILHSAWIAPVNGLAVGGGFQALSVIASFRGVNDPIVFLGLRGSVPVGNGIHLGLFGLGAPPSTAAPFHQPAIPVPHVALGVAQVTLGDHDLQITGSFGWGTTASGLTEHPAFALGGLLRITDRVAFISENWSLPFGREPYRIYTYGVRFMHRKFAGDVAFLINREFTRFFATGIPYVGIALRF